MRLRNVDEQTLYEGKSGWLESAVESLHAAGVEVIAPRETDPGVVELRSVSSAEDIVLDYANVRLPVKRLFLPITEVLLEFEYQEDGDVDVRAEAAPPSTETVVMGCRPCGAASLGVLDQVFHWDYDDLRYSARR